MRPAEGGRIILETRYDYLMAAACQRRRDDSESLVLAELIEEKANLPDCSAVFDVWEELNDPQLRNQVTRLRAVQVRPDEQMILEKREVDGIVRVLSNKTIQTFNIFLFQVLQSALKDFSGL